MAIIDPRLDPDGAEGAPLWRRLAWMAGIWAAGVVTLGVVAGVLRMWLR